MKQSIFSMRSTRLFLLLAVVVMAGMALSSCSKDDDERPMNPNTMVLDNEEVGITRIEYHELMNGEDVEITLYRAKNDFPVIIKLKKALHLGKPIAQDQNTPKEKRWGLFAYKGNEMIFETNRDQDASVIQAGTLLVVKNNDGTIKVELRNVKVKNSNGTMRTLDIVYEGKIG